MLARIENDTVIEVLTPIGGFKVSECFHKDLIALCVDIPNHAQVGWVLVGGEWQEPAPEEPVAEDPVAEPVAEEPAPEAVAEEPVAEEPVA